jgi:hypothetical protein
MGKRLVASSILLSALGLIGAGGFAHADTIVRYECNIIGTASQDPIGDREGHNLVTVQYTCFGVEGLLKGAVSTALSVSEWDGPQGKYLSSIGVHRIAGGLASAQLLEGAGSVIIKDGKPVGSESSGKILIKFASGTLAAISGKTLNYIVKPLGPNRFQLEWTE